MMDTDLTLSANRTNAVLRPIKWNYGCVYANDAKRPLIPQFTAWTKLTEPQKIAMSMQ